MLRPEANYENKVLSGTALKDAIEAAKAKTKYNTRTEGRILCCMCGLAIAPNKAGCCVSCLRSQVDITENIGKQAELVQCTECNKYLSANGNHWTHCDWESAELLALCLKKVPGLTKKSLNLVDAGFVWTEPHSKRIKLKIVVQKEVEQMNGVVLQQGCVVDLSLTSRMCPKCSEAQTNNTWHAVVQVRQKGDGRAGRRGTSVLHAVEQLVMDHQAQRECVGINAESDGLDFYFYERNQAVKLVKLLSAAFPCRVKNSNKLVSHNEKRGTSNARSSILVEIVPVCENDLLLLPSKCFPTRSGPSLVVVDKVRSGVHFQSHCGQRGVLNAESVFRWTANAGGNPDRIVTLMKGDQQERFTVLNVEQDSPQQAKRMAEAEDSKVKPKRTRGKGRRKGGRKKRGACDEDSSDGEDLEKQPERRDEYNTEECGKEKTATVLSEGKDEEAPYEGKWSAEVEVVRESDFGVNDTTYAVHAYGEIWRGLRAGDEVWGYHLSAVIDSIRGSQDLDPDSDLSSVDATKGGSARNKPSRTKGKRGKARTRRGQAQASQTDQLPEVVLARPCSSASAKQAKRLDELRAKHPPLAASRRVSEVPVSGNM